MGPPPVNGALPLGGVYDVRPQGSLVVAGARELLVSRWLPDAYQPCGEVASDSRTFVTERGLARNARDGPTDNEVAHVDDREVVWGGSLNRHYGHFLTESVARLWPTLPRGELDGLPVVFTMPKKLPFMVDWIEAFGVRAVELPKQGAVRFTRMFVPQPALRHGAWIAQEIRDVHLHARRGLRVPSAPRRDVLWLSRSKLRRNRVPYDQHLLEWLLDGHVTPIDLETLTIAEQIAALESCRAVAGVVGSAFHTLLMLQKPPDCLYLCPPWDRQAYPAQHQVLDCDATFVHGLSIAAHRRRMRGGIAFPAGYRVLIPEALRALSSTVLPGLLDDPRLASFAAPVCAGTDGIASEIDLAVAGLLRDPLAIEARVELRALLDAAGLVKCALEQSMAIEELTESG